MKALVTAFLLGTALAISIPANAATNVIANITGTTGSDPCNSTLIGRTAGFEVTSYAIGGTVPSNVGSISSGAGAGKPTLQNLVISKAFSTCSAELAKHFLTSQVIPTVTLYDYKTTGATAAFDFLTITLTDAFITSYQISDAAANEAPKETISIAYAKVCIASTAQTASGQAGATTTVCYNSASNSIS